MDVVSRQNVCFFFQPATAAIFIVIQNSQPNQPLYANLCYLFFLFFFFLLDYLEDPADPGYNAASPCYQGDGFARVMSVGPGKTFQSVVIGLVTFIHAFYVLYALKTGKADTTLLDKLEGMSNMIIMEVTIIIYFLLMIIRFPIDM